MTKPRYRVPSTAEIAAFPKNGFKSASTFAGCGGSSTGHKLAGFEVVYANEFIPDARKVYARNHPSTIIDDRDVRTVEAAEVLEMIGMKEGELDLLDGSPPCASYSASGRKAALWGKEKSYSGATQRTDDLFPHYVRLVKGIRPKVFVAENVSGLVKGVAKGVFIEVLDALTEAGYLVEVRTLDAQWLGVPQHRPRLIFVGVRRDLVERHGLAPAFPRPLTHFFSLAEALEGLEPPTAAELAECDISAYAIGKEWLSCRPGAWSDRYFDLIRPKLTLPCPTITATVGTLSAASVVHPNERRKFTARELRRICSFPDDYEFTGNYALDAERMGRAVPPLMMAAVASAIRDEILAKIPA